MAGLGSNYISSNYAIFDLDERTEAILLGQASLLRAGRRTWPPGTFYDHVLRAYNEYASVESPHSTGVAPW